MLFGDAQTAGESTDLFDRRIEDVAFRVTLETDDGGKKSLCWAGRENGEPVSFDTEPYASAGLKALVAVLRLLPIESQL